MKRCLVLLPWLLFAGCSAVSTRQPSVIEPQAEVLRETGDNAHAGEELAALLAYFDYVKKLPAPDLGKEYAQARQAFAKEASDKNRLQLALLLSLPQAAFHDDARALNLLEPLLKERGALRNFAALLNLHLAERKRLDDNVQTLNAKIKDEQKHSEALQQKLEALINLEKNLIEREATKK